MKLEVGKKYLNRNGNIVLVEDNHTSSGTNKTYPFCSSDEDDYQSYTELGTCFVSGIESKFDLLKEVILTKTGTTMFEVGKTYKDGYGGSLLVIEELNINACDYPIVGSYTDINGQVSIRTYTAEGVFNLELCESNLNLLAEEVVSETKFEVGKYYRSQDNSLFHITKIRAIENNLPVFPIEAEDEYGNNYIFTLKGTYFADNEANPNDLVCVAIVRTVEGENDLRVLKETEEVEEVEVVADTGFYSVEEVFLWLANGNSIRSREDKQPYSLLTFPWQPSHVSFAHWVKYVEPEPEPVRWYDQIPTQGIICWVRDNNTAICYQQIGIVYAYDITLPYPFRIAGCGYHNAVPLTKEELLARFSEDF